MRTVIPFQCQQRHIAISDNIGSLKYHFLYLGDGIAGITTLPPHFPQVSLGGAHSRQTCSDPSLTAALFKQSARLETPLRAARTRALGGLSRPSDGGSAAGFRQARRPLRKPWQVRRPQSLAALPALARDGRARLPRSLQLQGEAAPSQLSAFPSRSSARSRRKAAQSAALGSAARVALTGSRVERQPAVKRANGRPGRRLPGRPLAILL